MPYKIKPPLYTVWQSMKDRCLNPNNPQYKDYGGRGITICQEWIDSFQAFRRDMGDRPEGMLLDRIDNDKPYEAGNCRWVDRRTSQANRRNTVWVTIEGKPYLLADLARSAGLKSDTIKARAEKGMTYEQVIAKTRYVYTEGLKLGGKASGAARSSRPECQCVEPVKTHDRGIICQECGGNIYFDPTKEWREKRRAT